MIIYCCVHLFKKNTARSEVISARLSILLDLLSVQHEFQVFLCVSLQFCKEIRCHLFSSPLSFKLHKLFIVFFAVFCLCCCNFFERRFNRVRRKENDKEIVPFLKKTLLWKYDDKSF